MQRYSAWILSWREKSAIDFMCVAIVLRFSQHFVTISIFER